METFAEKGNEGIYFSLQEISCISLSALEKELPEGSGAGAYSISLCYLCGWLWGATASGAAECDLSFIKTFLSFFF